MASSQYNTMLPFRFNGIPFQQGHDSHWSGRKITRNVKHHSSQVYRMKTINILYRIYPFNDLLFINMFWQWQLNDESINFFIIIQKIHRIEQFLLGYG